jgi:hypothetical protein
MDCVVANHGGAALMLYKNDRGQCQKRLCFKLTGTKSNRSAIGAKIRVKANVYGQSIWQMRQISAQSGGGVGSQDDIRANFGLGNATTVDSVIIEWPSGYKQVLLNQSVNNCLAITEPNASLVCGKAYLDLNGNCQKSRT